MHIQAYPSITQGHIHTHSEPSLFLAHLEPLHIQSFDGI